LGKPYKNYTISGKTDGFGCQFNAKLSGLAFCLNSGGWSCRYRYVHTPFSTVSHGWTEPESVDKLNNFIGIPDNRIGKKIHVRKRFEGKVFNDPNSFYSLDVLNKIRSYYWSTPKPPSSQHEIAVHIRRGDVQIDRGGDRKRRYLPNYWYNKVIPEVAMKYPSDYRIAIHSEGKMSEFESILDGWHKDLVDRVTFKLAEDWVADQENDLMKTYHELVTSKVLVMSKSGLSYTAGILNPNDVFFVKSGARGQRVPLNHWIKTTWGGN